MQVALKTVATIIYDHIVKLSFNIKYKMKKYEFHYLVYMQMRYFPLFFHVHV